jgi:hypothetical protein
VLKGNNCGARDTASAERLLDPCHRIVRGLLDAN